MTVPAPASPAMSDLLRVPPGMRYVPGGAYTMGSERFYPEEAPARRVRVGAFFMDEAPVTNAAFATFVAATGYVTVAETAPREDDYPGIAAEFARAGSAVFDIDAAAGVHGKAPWWQFRAAASWRHPLGTGSGLEGLAEHPVVHVAYADALAYAVWAGKALPTEAEWEFAARSALEGADYAWGDELAPGGALLANYWQGEFPYVNERVDGWKRTSPVRSYPANAYGLFDLIDNVWEWTTDWWSLPPAAPPVPAALKSCCVPRNPRGGQEHASLDPVLAARIPRKVIKGGSHLCAQNYCQRYRPAARHPQAVDSTTSHIGFRCVMRWNAGAGDCAA
jgi:sulfatase modifying factor 1